MYACLRGEAGLRVMDARASLEISWMFDFPLASASSRDSRVRCEGRRTSMDNDIFFPAVYVSALYGDDWRNSEREGRLQQLSSVSAASPRIRRSALQMVAGTVGGTGVERIKGTDKEGLLDVSRLDR